MTTPTGVNFHLGQARDNQVEPIEVIPEHLFGRHCAVIGATGGGKSWTLARLLEECARYKSKVILFDASGEYYTLTHGVRHVYLGNDPAPSNNSKAVGVPYFHLRETDLMAIFRPSGPSQAPKLRMAMQSLKLARLAPHIAPDGTIMKAHRPKQEFDEQTGIFIRELETPYALFDIGCLVRQIQHECVDPFRSAVEPNIWGGINTLELSNCTSLVNRISDIISMPQLSCIFNPNDLPSIFDEVHTFLKDPVSRILRISLKYLPFDYSARETVANALARHLLELARDEVFRKQPMLLVVDEAHQFLNRKFTDELKETGNLDSFGLIAKEGRKYGLSVCLATQRPRDIPEDILSQMGTLLVHRLVNHYDLEVVEKAAGSIDRHLMSIIPMLKAGEALLVGVDFPLGRVINVKAPDCPPDSKSANYQKLWRA